MQSYLISIFEVRYFLFKLKSGFINITTSIYIKRIGNYKLNCSFVKNNDDTDHLPETGV